MLRAFPYTILDSRAVTLKSKQVTHHDYSGRGENGNAPPCFGREWLACCSNPEATTFGIRKRYTGGKEYDTRVRLTSMEEKGE